MSGQVRPQIGEYGIRPAKPIKNTRTSCRTTRLAISRVSLYPVATSRRTADERYRCFEPSASGMRIGNFIGTADVLIRRTGRRVRSRTTRCSFPRLGRLNEFKRSIADTRLYFRTVSREEKEEEGEETRIQTEMPFEKLAYRARAAAKRETNYSVEVLAFRFDLSPGTLASRKSRCPL